MDKSEYRKLMNFVSTWKTLRLFVCYHLQCVLACISPRSRSAESRRKGRAFAVFALCHSCVVYSVRKDKARMEGISMLTYTYVSEGTFALMEKPKPVLQHERDAIVG